ncbi:MAG TPA: hypothetical protein VK611_29860 [Acidimicrobiales bacterium]|nr:hypothetical protein [Acidimicrobiales bacterium]
MWLRFFLIWLAVLVGVAVAILVVLSIGLVVYPGAMRWTAPVLCPDGQSDSYVVRTTVDGAEGTSTSFSLFCLGERGDFTEVGSWRPLGILFAMTYGAVLALIAVGLAIAHVVRR